MTGPTPPVLHRAALERVLLRAAELQAASTEVPETLSEEELVALGAEVGLSATALRQALVEERMRVVLPEERGLVAALTGPATFVATRIVSGTPRDVLTKLHKMMDDAENLREVRRFPDRVVWGARGGFAGTIRTLTRLDGRGFPLARADEVSAVAVAADATRVHVRLEALLHERRRGGSQAGAAGVISGAGIGLVMAALGVMLPLAIAVGGGIAASTLLTVRRNYLRDARLAQLALEQTLDRLEFGEATKGKLFSL
ncbi:MAG TPA: hypothetical protein PLY94_05150 [Gemmatimonadaceae bacterium]|nr:hypothetical protein [Gemmatimonadaceae bacterium]